MHQFEAIERRLLHLAVELKEGGVAAEIERVVEEYKKGRERIDQERRRMVAQKKAGAKKKVPTGFLMPRVKQPRGRQRNIKVYWEVYRPNQKGLMNRGGKRFNVSHLKKGRGGARGYTKEMFQPYCIDGEIEHVWNTERRLAQLMEYAVAADMIVSAKRKMDGEGNE